MKDKIKNICNSTKEDRELLYSSSEEHQAKVAYRNLSVCTLPELDHDSKEPTFTKSISHHVQF